MPITRQQFIDLVGEDPIDVLGSDWENEAEEYLEAEKCSDCGSCNPGVKACFFCKQD